ncbi:MAG: outer membrane lipoprotein chaperone LolA [Proteobacteria bacterium]|nr:outer membrane lipoprotein chaperone LolA [Pseudomonadota bacterium]
MRRSGLRWAWLACAPLWLAAGAPAAAGSDTTAAASAPATALDRYLDGLGTLRASFSQVVVDASGKQLEKGQGILLVRRPGRFRWEYTPDDAGPQLLVADGSNLWFYDRELQQATVKPAAAALTATPVMLLSGSAADLRAAFTVAAGGAREGLDWVKVTPRSATAEFASAELGFRNGQLARLVIHDRLNQTDTLEFTDSTRGARVSDAELRFTPPAGVDVIGTPQPLPAAP